MTNIFDQRPGESSIQWVLRLHIDPWFEDCTPDELADFTGLPLKKVRGAVFAWAKSKRVRRIHQHATAIAERIGWPGTPEALIHIALERYAQRFADRQVEHYDLDGDIQRFLAEHVIDPETEQPRPAYSALELESRASSKRA